MIGSGHLISLLMLAHSKRCARPPRYLMGGSQNGMHLWVSLSIILSLQFYSLEHISRLYIGRDHATDGFYRASAAIQRSYANLFTRSIALRQLKTKADALNISPEMKEIVLSAIGSARECVDICVNNVEYRDGMRYGKSPTPFDFCFV